VTLVGPADQARLGQHDQAVAKADQEERMRGDLESPGDEA